VHALGGQGRDGRLGAGDVLAEEIAGAEPRQRLATSAAKERLGGIGIAPTLADQRRQCLGRLWPERTETLLAPLAAKPHLERPRELGVARPHVENLLDPRARVEHREQKRVVPASRGGPPVGGLEEPAHLIHLEVLDPAGARALEGDGEQPLASLEVLGLARCGVPGEGVHGREAGIARRGSIAALGFEVVEEGENGLGLEVREVEVDDVAPAARGEEPEEQRDGVAIAEDRARLDAPDLVGRF